MGGIPYQDDIVDGLFDYFKDDVDYLFGDVPSAPIEPRVRDRRFDQGMYGAIYNPPDDYNQRFKEGQYGDKFGVDEYDSDPDRSSGNYGSSFNRDLDAALSDIAKKYARSGGGGSNAASHQEAIADALELLGDISANRGAIAGAYEEYDEITAEFSDDALTSAEGISEEAALQFDPMFAERQAAINEAYANAESTVVDVAELIGAGAQATEAALSNIDGKQLELEMAGAEASEIMALIDLEEILFERQAISDRARDEGQIDRQAVAMDTQFKVQQDAAEDRLAAARKAAAAAAAARRRAAANRRAAQAEEEAAVRAAFARNEVDAGLFSMTNWMNQNLPAGTMADRADFLWKKANLGVEDFVPTTYEDYEYHFRDQGLSRDEITFLLGAGDSYADGRDGEWKASPTRGIPPVVDGRPS